MSMRPDQPLKTRICIVGAGFAGLGLGMRLRREGIRDFLILDGGSDVGGTWRDNHYPGCACDIPSHLYSYSFEPNPDWSRKFAPQAEIWKYLKSCARMYGLDENIRRQKKLRHARYCDSQKCWHLECEDGSRLECRVLVPALGPLSRPALPSLNGLERFVGPAFHSSQWRHDVDLAGKRVGVIGTGASAIQFVPQIAEQAASLYLFQRTPPWILPRGDRPIRKSWRLLYRKFPVAQRLARLLVYLTMESRALGLRSWPFLLKVMEARARRHIRAGIADPALRRMVTPGFRLGCKRVLLSDDYYPALSGPGVRLETENISEILDDGVLLDDGRRVGLDVLIYGTGFQATSPVPPGMIIGRSGIDIIEAWSNGPEAYLGTAVAGFPNMFMLVGPNTGLGHNSIVYMIESQLHYILQCLEFLQSSGMASLEIREQVQSDYNHWLQSQFPGSVWASGCKSWYLHESGKNTTLWPGMSFSFRRRTRHFDPADYVIQV
jgi:cation diffusion facilitator CzcD-associated flavoprotein CzcO